MWVSAVPASATASGSWGYNLYQRNLRLLERELCPLSCVPQIQSFLPRVQSVGPRCRGRTSRWAHQLSPRRSFLPPLLGICHFSRAFLNPSCQHRPRPAPDHRRHTACGMRMRPTRLRVPCRCLGRADCSHPAVAMGGGDQQRAVHLPPPPLPPPPCLLLSPGGHAHRHLHP